MRKGNINRWILGVLFGSVLAYTAWTGLGTQTLLMGKTSEISGRVIEVFPNEEVQSYNRRIKYIYSVDDNFYFDFKKLGTEDAKQEIGNDLKLVYSVKKPEKNKVTSLSSTYNSSVGRKYYATKENGFIELQLINGIFKYKEFAVGGTLIHDFVGEYKITNDSIKFENYIFETDNKNKNRPELFVFSPGNNRQLVDLSTEKIFRRM